MRSQEFRVKNKAGLHMRPANLLAREMKKYSSQITVKSGKKSADGKSIISLMASGISEGDSFTVICEGSDESEMLFAAAEIIDSSL